MIMKIACLIAAATSVNAFVSQPKRALHLHLLNQELAANLANNNDKADRVNKNLFDDVMGVLFPKELPSLPNLIREFLKEETSIESVEDFDVDLAHEIEVALALAAEEGVTDGSMHDVASQEQPQSQTPPPLNSYPMGSSINQVETAFNATYAEEQHSPSKGIPRSDNGDASDYIKDGQFHNNDENCSPATNNDDKKLKHLQLAAAQLLADQSIRAGLEKKSVEESYEFIVRAIS